MNCPRHQFELSNIVDKFSIIDDCVIVIYTIDNYTAMRIALLTDSYHPTKDGVATTVAMMRKSLEELGHTVWIVAPDPGEGNRSDDPNVIWIRSISLKSYQGYFIPVLPSLDRIRMRALNLDILHVHGVATMAIRGLVLAYILKLPIVMNFHTMVGDVAAEYSPIKLPKKVLSKSIWLYLKNIMKRMDAVIVHTPSVGNELLEHAPEIKLLSIIPAGIDTDLFRPGQNGEEFRKRYNLVGDRKRVFHIGRVSFEKEIDMAIRAIADVDAELVIVGSGPQRKELEELVSELELENKVTFLGFIPDEDLPYAYASADVLISCSAFETQSLSLLEAMSSGVPCVCRNARAFRDIIIEGGNGFLFDDDKDCAQAIKRGLSADEVLRNAARNYGLEHSGINSAEKTIELYKEVIGNRYGTSESNTLEP